MKNFEVKTIECSNYGANYFDRLLQSVYTIPAIVVKQSFLQQLKTAASKQALTPQNLKKLIHTAAPAAYKVVAFVTTENDTTAVLVERDTCALAICAGMCGASLAQHEKMLRMYTE